ncbi:MAG: hypothetical protein ABJX32_04415 [Tateyamaria sp.]|uniref:hypothetical protein n=1 Tax=Tateyamaria sp. TaxID=1929288 RepID=UPI00329DFF69
MSFSCQNGVCSNKGNSHRQTKIRRYQSLVLLSGLCGIGLVAHAQEALPEGVRTYFDVTQRFEFSDNPDLDTDGESDFFGRTILGYGLESERSFDAFRLRLGTELEIGRKGESTTNLTNSFARLSYERDARNSDISLNADYREVDVTSDDFDEDFDQDGNVINQDSGTRQSYGFRISSEIRKDAPIGATFGLSYREINFRDANDPDLRDSSTLSLSGSVDFRISPNVTTSIVARYRDFDTEFPGTSRETIGLGVATELRINPVLTANAELRYDRIDRSGGSVETDEGVSLETSLTRDLKNGSLRFELNSDVVSNDDSRRGYFGVARSMELPRGQGLSYSLGLTRSDSTGFDPLVALDYRYDLPTGQINIGLTQFVATNDNNEESINTRLRASTSRQINSVSTIGANVSFYNVNELGDTGEDSQRFSVGLSYERVLTRDWSLISGYSYILRKSDDTSDRDSNTVFVGLSRRFE